MLTVFWSELHECWQFQIVTTTSNMTYKFDVFYKKDRFMLRHCPANSHIVSQ